MGGGERWDAVAYALAYQFGIAVGIGHSEAVRHAALEARAERDPRGFGRIARAIRELEEGDGEVG